MKKRRAIIYMGFNHPRKHKRGVENVIHVQSLALAGARKFYVFFDDEQDVTRWNGMCCLGIRRGPLRMLRMNVLLLTLLWRLRGSSLLLHSHNYLMTLCALRKTDVFSVHDGLFYQMKSLRRRHLQLFKWVECVVYRRSRFVHFNSEFTRQTSEFKNDRPSRVVHCSTHLERYAPSAPSRHLPGRTLSIVSVRSIEERARIDLLLDVAEILRRSGSDAKVAVGGKGPLLEYYRGEIERRKLTNIKLLGFVPDDAVAELYKSADLVLMPCEYGEGFGLPVIEGWLFNRPVLASNRCAVPEVMEDGRFLFENDAQAICRKICEVLDLSSSLDFRARYDSRFSQRVIVDRHREIYETMFTPDLSGTGPQAL